MNRATTTYPLLCKGYIEVFFAEGEFRNVEEPRHAGTTWNGAATEQHVLRQEVKAGVVAKISDLSYHPKDWAKGMVQWVVSKNAGPNIDQEKLVTCTWLHTSVL
ncbi:hypothetical protein TNCV_182221 [Trichonephila clavipes]|nr:hypothetical protein TNCV_182221 [Trichonephila clavipes]